MYSSEERQWAMLAHIITMVVNVCLGGLGFLVGLIIYAVNPPKSRFVAFHALQSTLFQLAMAAVVWVCFFTFWLIIPIFIGIAAGLAGFILPIIGGIKANKGEVWTYPLVGRFCLKSSGL
jgi:uncharacterized protein